MTARAASDTDWLAVTRGIRRGDPGCFELFFDTFFDCIMREARRSLGRDEATSLDIVQDAMVKSLHGMRPIGNRGQLTQWCKVVVRTTAIDWIRRKRRQRLVDLADTSLADVVAASDEGADDLNGRLAWLEEQLQQLEPPLRTMLTLRYRLGWTLQRIGKQFGLRTGAVDGRIRRAVEQLKTSAMRHDAQEIDQ